MAVCTANDLLESARCFAMLPMHLQEATKAALWCQISRPSPITIPGLKAWFDADDLETLFQDNAFTTPITSDGQPVGGWEDKSGNDYNVGNAGSGRPVYRTNIINGKPVVSWVSTDSLPFLGTAWAGVLRNVPGATLFAVVSQPALTTGAKNVFRLNAGDGNTRAGMVVNGTSAATPQAIAANGKTLDADSVVNVPGTAGTIAANIPILLTARFDYAGGRIDVYTNGNASEGNGAITSGNTSDTDSSASSINGLGFTASNLQIGEVLLYNRALDDIQREFIRDYLNNKWNVY